MGRRHVRICPPIGRYTALRARRFPDLAAPDISAHREPAAASRILLRLRTNMIPACNFNSESCADLTQLRISSGKVKTRVESLEKSQTKIERRLDQLLWFLLLIFSTSAGTLALAVFKR